MMGNEAAASARGARREVGADQLAQGLLLVRASAIKVVRFQLAMERRDRRVALEAVDDLVVLDRKIEDFLSDIPGSLETYSAFEDELATQRQALVREKFTLGAGSGRPGRTGEEAVPNRNGGAVRSVDLPADDELIVTAPSSDEPIARRAASVAFSRLLAGGLVLALFALVAMFFFLAGSGAPFAQGAS